MSFGTGGIGTSGPWVQSAGNGVTDEFSLAHKVYDQNDIVVLSTVDATNVTTTQVIGAGNDYTVSGVAEDAHQDVTPIITMNAAPASGLTITRYRKGRLVQDLVLGATVFWQSLSAELKLDLMVMDMQWMNLLIQRCAIGSLASPAVTTTLEEILAAAGITDLSTLVAKTAAVAADLLRLGDSEDSFEDKKLTLANLVVFILAQFVNTSAGAGDAGKGIKLNGVGLINSNMITDGSDSTAVHINVAAEIAGLAAIVLADGDALIIEDLDAGPANSKKKLLASAIWTYILAKIAANAITIGGTLDADDNDIVNIKVATLKEEHDNGNSGATATVDWNNGNMQKITLTANCTITFTPPTTGVGRFDLKVIQDGTGSRTVTWASLPEWTGGVAPTLTTTATTGKDVITFRWDGTNYLGVASLDFSAP